MLLADEACDEVGGGIVREAGRGTYSTTMRTTLAARVVTTTWTTTWTTTEVCNACGVGSIV